MTLPPPAGTAPPTSAGVHVPPPLLFALTLGGSYLLNRAVPLPLLPAALRPVAIPLGWTLVLLALLLGGWALFSFFRARTAVLPNRPATRLVHRGPYLRSRNPMYVGLLTLFLGVTILTNLAWAALFGTLPVLLLLRWIVPAEERYLEARFGDEYREYQGRVRRWI